MCPLVDRPNAIFLRKVESGLTDEQKATWATYRQSLRDITEVDGFPDVEFPTKP